MPSAVPVNGHDVQSHDTGVTKFTNCLLVKGDELVEEDLWISSVSGKILNGQEILYEHRVAPDNVIDLGGRILSPGLIDVQLNGAYGFDFSVIPEEGSAAYGKGFARVNRDLIETGVTSYLPTLTSQRPEVYENALPFLGPSGASRNPLLGSESLGAHCEGPFISKSKNGIHKSSVLREPTDGLASLEQCYGSKNLRRSSPIKLLTLAPELSGAISSISSLTNLGIIASIGHSEATYEEALLSTRAGATMITHLFNAMAPLHHRNPGIFGLLGTTAPPPSPGSSKSATPTSSTPASPSPNHPQSFSQPPPHSQSQNHLQTPPKPYFGIIADGIHLHPTSLRIAYTSHPTGLILVTDAMHLAGLPDGTYPWTNGSSIRKSGSLLTLLENGKIAGSCISLVECVNNFIEWTGASVPVALRAVTLTPARMLGVGGVKGGLGEGGDADLVVFGRGGKGVVVDEVWKFGVRVFRRGEKGGGDV
ncbi:carbohydrate esterase family 9 protein [Lophiostoma macrostomum CBS 122681]|uniref:Carbohydrate esterase family 9 protein n=1 Tax=Lophiostoma macrostomum CBS 122681 TaxID=1314788 RepID=A0A6A6TNB7_9PLEO|nr:carbohydrate esterase family 9 protein [Lophiostoma macrostomum CBS 122681]